MSVTVKSKHEIELMREAGRILGTVLKELEKECKPGVTTYHINKIGDEMIKSYGCIPSFYGYQGYPASICVSVNDETLCNTFGRSDFMRVPLPAARIIA